MTLKEHVITAVALQIAFSLQASPAMCLLPCRCLTVDTPSAREKFETLKDIAEEHDVDWDIEKAEQEMLPAGGPASEASSKQ